MKLLRISQVAEQCSVEERTVRFWVSSKQLPAVNLTEKIGRGSRLRIKQSDLDLFLSRRSTVAEQPVQRRRKRIEIPRIVKVS